MSVREILETVEFVIDHNGKAKAAIVDIQIWQAFVAWLEEQEDSELVHARITGWREKKEWRRWEEFDTELELG